MTKLTFYGGVGSVTGANFLLEVGGKKILVDCGLLQGVEGSEHINAEKLPYDAASIDFLFITHAHMDHIGRVPKLVREGFAGVIYSTKATKEIAVLMFEDALRVAKHNDPSQTPLYDEADVRKAVALWQTFNYGGPYALTESISVKLLDAGHILGSSMYEFEVGGKKIFFTGDSGNSPSPLLRDTEKISGVDYLVMDSVYGDRNHESKAARDKQFETIVREVIANRGTLVVPAFSIDRTQVILYELNNLVEEKGVPKVPVFLDSPLAEKVTEIYRHSTDLFNNHVQEEIKNGDDIFSFPKLSIVHNGFESHKVDELPSPKIIIAGSGMSTGGRVVAHEKKYIGDPNATILLMGYQALGTLGREIENRPKEVMIDGEKFPVRARIEMVEGYSAHKDLDHLLDMASDTAESLKKAFVVMGEPKASMFLAQRLRDYLGVDAIYPGRGKAYELE